MIREIKKCEKITDRFEEQRRREREGFRKIKPETNITTEECNEYFREVFRRVHEEAVAASQGR